MRPGRALAVAALVAATAVTFWPVLINGFVNWDDPDVLVANPHLRQPFSSLLTWAFTTTHMGHYQPLSWLALAGLAGAAPARVHAVSLTLHLVNVALLVWVAARISYHGQDDDSHWWGATAAAAVFAVHPLRVEPIAWASALPYLLSYAPLLAAVGCWVMWSRAKWRPALWWASLGLYAVSQLARVTAPFLPVVLYLLTRADERARPRSRRELAQAAAPFAALVLPLGAGRGRGPERRGPERHRPGAAPHLGAAASRPVSVAHARARRPESARSAAARPGAGSRRGAALRHRRRRGRGRDAPLHLVARRGRRLGQLSAAAPAGAGPHALGDAGHRRPLHLRAGHGAHRGSGRAVGPRDARGAAGRPGGGRRGGRAVCPGGRHADRALARLGDVVVTGGGARRRQRRGALQPRAGASPRPGCPTLPRNATSGC